MELLVLDDAVCVGCGMCAMVCHNRCVALCGGTPVINEALCDGCAQCVAVCPQRALSWDGVSPVPVDEANLPSAQELDELFKQRRSIRFFKEERIDRSVLSRTVRYGAYAPTNNHDMRAVIVDDREILETLEQAVVQFNSRMYRLFVKPRPVFALLRRIAPNVNPRVKAKLEGRRSDSFHPAAMVLVVGDPRIAFSEASAQAALDLMMLYAQIQGIGSCLWGAGRMVLNRNRDARRRLGLQGPERILGILLLGYPAVEFGNKVEGRTMPIVWNGGRETLV